MNIGTDICQISRIYGILSGPRATRFVHRILAPEEQLHAASRLASLSSARVREDVPTDGVKDGVYAQRDPEIWKTAAFIAGRQVYCRLPTSEEECTPICEEQKVSSLRANKPWVLEVPCRFAAKEAAIKAHSHRRLTFHDIIIERRGRDEERLGSGPPVARIRAQKDDKDDGDGQDMSAMISISHDGDYATAVCLGYDPSVVADEGQAQGKEQLN